MAISGCSSGLVVTAVVALLLLPAQYYMPDLNLGIDDHIATPEQSDGSLAGFAWFDLEFLKLPPLDLFVTVTLVFLGLFTYICEWIQRKLMERRIIKLNQYLGASLERLRTWDEQQEQQEATLKMVQNATSEYNLLLYLLLRQHHFISPHNTSSSNCFLNKNLDDDLTFLRNLKLDA